VLFLATTGRRSGQLRRNGLYFIEDGGTYVVVASNAGAKAEPAWWLNLQANPEAVVELRGRSTPVRARRATAVEQAGLWPEFVRRDGTFAEYEQATSRQVAVVILEPRD
jgi:deazaflavin-dependent oxidoreductase (nitroreductase family)